MLKDYLSKLLVFAVLFWATGTALSQSPLTISAPVGIAGDYIAVQAAFGPWANAQAADLVLIDDGTGVSNGCAPAANDLTGKIALIDRGACAFTVKALNAEAAGAIAVVVCNNSTLPDTAIVMGGTDGCALTIPAVMISYNNCQIIKAELGNGVTATMPANKPADGEAVGAEIALPGAGTYTATPLTGTGSLFSDAVAAKVYTIVAPSDAVMNVNSCNGGADTRLVVLQGCRNALSIVGDNDDACDLGTGELFASSLDVVVYAGQTYLIYWDDVWDANGFDFNVSFGALPTVNLTFNVDMSQSVVNPSGMKIAGSFTGWTQTDMTDNGDGTWSYTAAVTAGDELQWKYLNGTDGWEPSADLTDCGIDDGFGGFNRYGVAGLTDENLGLVCIGSCYPCPPPACSNPNAIICDNFDNYAAGSTTAANAPWWSTWSGAVGGAEDGIVSDAQASSAPNSLLVANTGAQDVLLLLGNQTGGKYRLAWNMYIPANHVGYYNVQDDETPGVAWNLNMHFGNDTQGNTAVFGEGVVAEDGSTFTYPEDTWFEVVHMFDLDANNLRTFVNGVMVSSMDFTGNLGAIDFFSINSDNTFYIDDVEYTAVLTECPANALICDGLEFYATGSNTAAQAAWWSTWSGAEGGPEDGIVSGDQAYEGINSMLVSNTGAQDVLLLLGNKSTGSYRLSWQMYVPTGAHGYFNIQNEETPGVQWNMEAYFNRKAASATTTPGLGETTLATDDPFAFPQDQWFEVAMAFDLDNDQMAVFIDGTRIGLLPYTGNIGSIDFFSVDNTNTYYIDNVLYTELPACDSPDALICDNLEFYEGGSFTSENAAWWSTWSGASAGPEDGIVSTDYAQSGTKSLYVGNTGAQDVLLLLGNQTSGSYNLRWSMYIPAGHVAYYNVQEDETPGVAWNLNMHFGNDTQGNTATFGQGVVAETGTAFTYPEDTWFDVVHTFNLDDNTMDIWVDGVQVESGAPYTGNLGGIDIFSINSDNTVYFDDVLYEALPVPTVSVTFAVDLTYYLAAGNTLETVKIAGNFGANGAALPDWDPTAAPAFTDLGNDVWSTTIEFPAASAGQNLEFKFLNTATSWGNCGVQQECMGAEDANCKNPNNDNRLLVIPAVDTDLCYTWETCLGCNVVATHEFIEIPMTIAPNPFSEQTVVSFNSAILDGQVRLTNLAGQVMRVYAVNGPQLIIAKGDLAPGMYFLNVVTEDGTSAAQKLVVE
ncbi:MAG: T9SS type A sorting domain-containing protein [Saprospiraceae bacterium]|nr:MAG: T9SS type A sorting domain-containing protein [Saprospiraceae bacterium]